MAATAPRAKPRWRNHLEEFVGGLEVAGVLYDIGIDERELCRVQGRYVCCRAGGTSTGTKPTFSKLKSASFRIWVHTNNKDGLPACYRGPDGDGSAANPFQYYFGSKEVKRAEDAGISLTPLYPAMSAADAQLELFENEYHADKDTTIHFVKAGARRKTARKSEIFTHVPGVAPGLSPTQTIVSDDVGIVKHLHKEDSKRAAEDVPKSYLVHDAGILQFAKELRALLPAAGQPYVPMDGPNQLHEFTFQLFLHHSVNGVGQHGSERSSRTYKNLVASMRPFERDLLTEELHFELADIATKSQIPRAADGGIGLRDAAARIRATLELHCPDYKLLMSSMQRGVHAVLHAPTLQPLLPRMAPGPWGVLTEFLEFAEQGGTLHAFGNDERGIAFLKKMGEARSPQQHLADGMFKMAQDMPAAGTCKRVPDTDMVTAALCTILRVPQTFQQGDVGKPCAPLPENKIFKAAPRAKRKKRKRAKKQAHVTPASGTRAGTGVWSNEDFRMDVPSVPAAVQAGGAGKKKKKKKTVVAVVPPLPAGPPPPNLLRESAQARGAAAAQRVQSVLDASAAKAEVHLQALVRPQLTTPKMHATADNAMAPMAPIMSGDQSAKWLNTLGAFDDNDDDL